MTVAAAGGNAGASFIDVTGSSDGKPDCVALAANVSTPTTVSASAVGGAGGIPAFLGAFATAGNGGQASAKSVGTAFGTGDALSTSTSQGGAGGRSTGCGGNGGEATQ